MVKVILKTDVPGQGKKDQIIEASEGYVRNYLIPKGKAIIANSSAVESLEAEKKRNLLNQKNLENNFRKIKKEIEDIDIEIKRKLINEEKLFGTLSQKEISEALLKKGVTVSAKQINLKQPIKAVGEYDVEVVLDRNIKANLKIKVVGE